MWPMVPIVHMYYRMTQLGRGFALNAAMSGPLYICVVLVCLMPKAVHALPSAVTHVPGSTSWLDILAQIVS